MKKYLVIICAALVGANCASYADTYLPLKPRLVVLTDIGPAEVEPDDNESAVRLMAYADRFEIEAICTTVGWNCDPYPTYWAEYLTRVIDAYEIDVNNLMKRSSQSGFLPLEAECGAQQLGYWPSAEYLRGRAVMGSTKAGIGVIGEGNDSPGSELLIRLADEDDPRPIWVTAWGSGNTLAQAIWKVKTTRSPEELEKFIKKFRLYTITDQDMQWSMRNDRAYSAHQWLRDEFHDSLMLVWDESAWLNHNALGVENWGKYQTMIQGRGALGKVYPNYLWGVEGDTPSFQHLQPNGLNDPNDPTQIGWGGYHVYHMSPDSITSAWTNWHEPAKTISDTYEKKFFIDEFNDFAARMQWAEAGAGNTNPIVIVNGDTGYMPMYINATPGSTITLDASASYDPDGDNLRFEWWIPVTEETYGKQQSTIISSPTAATTTVALPRGFTAPLHIICEVHDNGPFGLVAYRRVILYPSYQ